MSEAFDKHYESVLYEWERARINIDNPEFNKAGRVHDWRNHVPYEVKKIWNELSEDEKKVFVLMAAENADREEWD